MWVFQYHTNTFAHFIFQMDRRSRILFSFECVFFSMVDSCVSFTKLGRQKIMRCNISSIRTEGRIIIPSMAQMLSQLRIKWLGSETMEPSQTPAQPYIKGFGFGNARAGENLLTNGFASFNCWGKPNAKIRECHWLITQRTRRYSGTPRGFPDIKR